MGVNKPLIHDSKLTIKLPKKLHNDFNEAVVKNGDKAAKLIRNYIENYIEKSK